MSLDLNDPEVKALLEAEATKLAEGIVSENYVPASEIEGLKNKNSELLGKLAKNKERFANLDDNDVVELQRIKAARENDELIDMIMKGKTSEAKTRLTEGVVAPWQQKTADLEAQFNAAQETISEYKARVEEQETKNLNMQKRTYLRELTSSDDSFKGDHFDDFYMLQSNKMDISQEDGNVYALDASGKPVLDTEGNRVSYADFYGKMKVSSGLFWSGGNGSGAKGGPADGSGLPANPFTWTDPQKTEFIKANSPEAYGKVLSNWNAKQRAKG